MLFNKEVLPAFSTFIIENVQVVEVTVQALYGIGPDESFLVPRFSKLQSSDIALPFVYVATAISRNLDLAFADPVDFRIWSIQDKHKTWSYSRKAPSCLLFAVQTSLQNWRTTQLNGQ